MERTWISPKAHLIQRKGYWRFWEGAGGWNLKVNAVLWHTARQTVYLACLPSHVLRAYCNFESKQANSITLFGRRPNKKESLNTARKCSHYRGWLSSRISWLGKNQVSVVRIDKCLWAFSRYQKLSETPKERSIDWRMCSIWHKLHSLCFCHQYSWW